MVESLVGLNLDACSVASCSSISKTVSSVHVDDSQWSKPDMGQSPVNMSRDCERMELGEGVYGTEGDRAQSLGAPQRLEEEKPSKRLRSTSQ